MGWCDRVEREKARRGIKGPENVPEPRWQQEGGLRGEEEERRRGGGEVGGMEEDEGGPQELDWQVKGQGGG